MCVARDPEDWGERNDGERKEVRPKERKRAKVRVHMKRMVLY